MLSINATIENDTVVLAGLQEIADELPGLVREVLTAAAKGTYDISFDLLSGPGAKASNVPAGGYPVPMRSGHLRRLLNWLKPGASKDGFTAGDLEAVLYNSAEYANVIHEGLGSSRKFGPRRYLTDAGARFNAGNKISDMVGDEISDLIKKKGFN